MLIPILFFISQAPFKHILQNWGFSVLNLEVLPIVVGITHHHLLLQEGWKEGWCIFRLGSWLCESVILLFAIGKYRLALIFEVLEVKGFKKAVKFRLFFIGRGFRGAGADFILFGLLEIVEFYFLISDKISFKNAKPFLNLIPLFIIILSFDLGLNPVLLDILGIEFRVLCFKMLVQRGSIPINFLTVAARAFVEIFFLFEWATSCRLEWSLLGRSTKALGIRWRLLIRKFIVLLQNGGFELWLRSSKSLLGSHSFGKL